MSDDFRSELLPEPLQNHIDEFEEEWSAWRQNPTGPPPCLDDRWEMAQANLQSVSQEVRDRFLFDLLYTDVYAQQRIRDDVREEEYYAHFPDKRQLISEVFRQVGPRTEPVLPGATPGVATAMPELKVSRYEIHEKLGEGGMGVVYKAHQTSVNRDVALKMILPGVHAGEADLSRFRTEAEAIARLQHPNIVQIYEAGEHQGQPYISMELCAGGSLMQKLNGTVVECELEQSSQADVRGLFELYGQSYEMVLNRDFLSDQGLWEPDSQGGCRVELAFDGAPLVAAEAAEFVEVLARAVQAMHDAGVVHRDLKPANVMLARFIRGCEPPDEQSGGSHPPFARYTPKIADFGLAKKLDEAGQTARGAVMGTPSYMAPEQADGEAVGPLADVYSLGAVLYECLTGRPPFKAATPLETLQQVCNQEPEAPRLLNPKVPRDLETICLKCLQKEPVNRYASARELADDLGRFRSHEPIKARRTGLFERIWKWYKRESAHTGFWVFSIIILMISFIIGICAVVLLVLALLLGIRSVFPTAERDHIELKVANQQVEDARRGEEEQRFVADDRLSVANTEPHQEVKAMMTTTYERGFVQGQREIALRQLVARFGPLSPTVEQRVEALSPAELRQLTLDLLKAQSLKDLHLEE